MHADDVVNEPRGEIRAIVSSWAGTPAFLCDRHLTVVVSNNAARALSAAFSEGVNLARFTFLEPGIDRDQPGYDAAAHQVAALLRVSLNQHRADDASFRGIVGDLSVMSMDFATAWADTSLPAQASGVIDFADTPEGLIRMAYQVLHVPNSDGDALIVWGARDTESSQSLARLVKASTGS
ncbi:hypothetical protein [Cryobacterium arcticum]|uniref:MmyB-like transcription regulator ligand binding domain-containing protein n=1 Tax=Cryobacterium arcticum TaxID=670052 RepID=A0A1B1BI23_9MICO|nr:hypothetical protein [Cryobacterium arcticum]ANP72220.1 hypothetical protein PA27867_1257 [Cryobacterium arcticum]